MPPGTVHFGDNARRPDRTPARPMVLPEAVHKSFGALEVLKGIDLHGRAAAR